MSRVRCSLAVVLALAATASAADAATRHATPSPAAGADCTEAKPCGLIPAIANAASGDTVVGAAPTEARRS